MGAIREAEIRHLPRVVGAVIRRAGRGARRCKLRVSQCASCADSSRYAPFATAPGQLRGAHHHRGDVHGNRRISSSPSLMAFAAICRDHLRRDQQLLVAGCGSNARSAKSASCARPCEDPMPHRSSCSLVGGSKSCSVCKRVDWNQMPQKAPIGDPSHHCCTALANIPS